MKHTNFSDIDDVKRNLQNQIAALGASDEITKSCERYVEKIYDKLKRDLDDLERNPKIDARVKDEKVKNLQEQAGKDLREAPTIFKLMQTLGKATQFDDVNKAKEALIDRIKKYELDPNLEKTLINNINGQDDLKSLKKTAVVLNLIDYSFSADVVDYQGKALNKSCAIEAFMQGGHLAIPDSGQLEKALNNLDFLGATARRSSHYTKTRDDIGGNSFQAPGIFNEVLFGRAKLVDTKGLPAISYFQLENSPFVAPKSMKAIKQNVSHTLDFLKYVVTKKNIGQYGSSGYTDSRAMLAIPAEMDTTNLEAKQKKIFDAVAVQREAERKGDLESASIRESQTFIRKCLGAIVEAIVNKFASSKEKSGIIVEKARHIKRLLKARSSKARGAEK